MYPTDRVLIVARATSGKSRPLDRVLVLVDRAKFHFFHRFAHKIKIMTIERTIYFANHRAYSIQDTIQWLYNLKERNALAVEKFDNLVSDLIDLKYLVNVDDSDQMLDVWSDGLRTRSEWFLLYGIIDRTFEYFDGTDASVGTWTVDEVEMIELDTDSITSEEEYELVSFARGTYDDPIVLSDSDDEDYHAEI